MGVRGAQVSTAWSGEDEKINTA